MRVPRTVTPNAAGLSAKPKIIIADDHKDTLTALTSLLAPEFDILAVALDGSEALNLALRLDPDVLVLDQSMPELSGIQTLRELRRAGSRARVVFQSMHGMEELVIDAIGSGALGFVQKTRILWDLGSAVDHALAGRLFMPYLRSLRHTPGTGHTVQFHATGSLFLDEVSRFIGSTLS